MKNLLFLLLGLATAAPALAQGNNYAQNYHKYEGLALTPPMGWNSWNKFACNVDEKLIREVADAMVASGMRDAGYTYVNIDDCWHGERDAQGFIHPDSKRFPSGMKALADYIHSQGLKFGVYSDAGSQTCGGRPGSRGYEFQDAQMYASWGVDYLKYDWCNTEGLKAEGAYKTMTAALRQAGRPIVFSICEWGTDKPWDWGQTVGHLWRTTGDIYNCFDCIEDHGTWKSFGVLAILDKQEGLRQYAGPGHWNDPDMLEVGNGMPENEDRAHFTMWSMLAAPLITGNDIRTMSPQTQAILTNKEVVAINQDKLGVQGFRHSAKDSVETWLKPLNGGNWAVTFLNRSRRPQPVTFDWKATPIVDSLSKTELNATKTTYKVRNVWAKKDAGTTKKAFQATVPAHDVIMLVLRK
ncbi:glycoside hydrolase family 27 protein [Hymenobacter sp. BT18]|uniref:glycoside hydrolase family 27 protein n=1 Tax=Hymenobacter sp. BT18 TaxID=2835648 RepID=UPI00143ED76A|nr:glycoside hydrolase family 27 protein [Hymenobacter sp. BT18]QIX60131.1 glycoside hydrolase family 27 protein [Hymenobacter sp. BT18]